MFRRLALVGIFVLIKRGSIVQLVVGVVFCAVWLLLQMQAAPFRHLGDNYLASSCSFALLVFFLSCLVSKVGTLTEVQDVQAVLTFEQASDFVVPDLALAVLLFLSSLSALLASFALLLLQLGLERVRMSREARASKARRLRRKDTGEEVEAPVIEDDAFHLFLSHVWDTGQDQMRIVKQRLLEMIPDLTVFLDVDDLEEIGDLENCVEQSCTVLVYCSTGYFHSQNCMRELVATTTRQKPCFALIDPAAKHGGVSVNEALQQLVAAEEHYERWDFEVTTPQGHELHTYLFAAAPIEWNRLGVFQDVTMRLIAERLLPNAAGATCVDHELVSQKLKPLRPPTADFHVYCSEANPGAAALMKELGRERSLDVKVSQASTSPGSRYTSGSRRTSFQDASRFVHQMVRKVESRKNIISLSQRIRSKKSLIATAQPRDLAACDHMLLYLNAQTWTRGAESDVLAEEVRQAMDVGVHLLLAHEMPGVGGHDSRHACEFHNFFSCPEGTTPHHLLQRGVYSQIAVALKGGAWRETSMALLLKALSMSKEEVQTAEEGRDVFKQGTSVRETSFPRGQGLGIRAVVASLPTRRLQSSWLATRRANAVGISSTGESSVTSSVELAEPSTLHCSNCHGLQPELVSESAEIEEDEEVRMASSSLAGAADGFVL